MTFENQIEQELQSLNKEEQIAFAWRCAIRALPLLCNKGDFGFWDKEDVQGYLYSIIYVLDASIIATDFNDYSFDVNLAALAAVNTASITYSGYNDVSYTASAAYSSYAAAADAASYKASASTVSAASCLVPSDSEITINDIVSIATHAVDAAQMRLNLKDIILEDIANIKSSEPQKISTKTYGKTWDNFQSALKNEACEYWAKLYQDIFDNNFELDKEALKRRINVPKEIRDKGASEVGKYLEALELQGGERLNEARIIILGDKGAGKTCVARKLVNPQADMTTPVESTAGVETSLWEKDHINIRIWDFAGHTVTHAVHQFFLSSRCLYIMVYDGRTEERNRLKYWLDHMKNYGGDSKAIILVNERDQNKIDIPINKLKTKYPIVELFSFNLEKDQEELKVFRNYVAEYITKNPSWKNQQIPSNYYAVKSELEKLFNKKSSDKNQELITIKEFNTIAEKYNVSDKENLLQSLHYLGVSLWYQQMKKYDTLILNPEWISHGVYQIINWVSNLKIHSLTLPNFSKVFKEDLRRYPETKHQFLFELMKHYELAYETNNEKELIIPHLLQEDQPSVLPDFEGEENLLIKYEADRPLPPHTISRFIVRHHQQIKIEGENPLVWRYGVILIDGQGGLALVHEDDRTINIAVRGPSKTYFLSQIRDTLNAIFDSYKSEKPELNYNIKIGKPELWLEEEKIVLLSKSNKPYYDPLTKSDIPMRPVVVTYNITNNYYASPSSENNNIPFDFYECNIELQASLNELAKKMSKKGKFEDAEELLEAVEILNEFPETTNQKDIRRKGVIKKLKRILEELNDDLSDFHQTIKSMKHGISIAQDIANEYNRIADWLSLSTVEIPYVNNLELTETISKQLNQYLQKGKTEAALKLLIQELANASHPRLKDAKSYLWEFKKNEKDYFDGISTSEIYRSIRTRINRGIITLLSVLTS